LGVGQFLEALAYFPEGEVLVLKALDETEPSQVTVVVVGTRAAGFGCGEEALLDVVANGARSDFGGVAELGEIEGACGGKHTVM